MRAFARISRGFPVRFVNVRVPRVIFSYVKRTRNTCMWGGGGLGITFHAIQAIRPLNDESAEYTLFTYKITKRSDVQSAKCEFNAARPISRAPARAHGNLPGGKTR